MKARGFLKLLEAYISKKIGIINWLLSYCSYVILKILMTVLLHFTEIYSHVPIWCLIPDFPGLVRLINSKKNRFQMKEEVKIYWKAWWKSSSHHTFQIRYSSRHWHIRQDSRFVYFLVICVIFHLWRNKTSSLFYFRSVLSLFCVVEG